MTSLLKKTNPSVGWLKNVMSSFQRHWGHVSRPEGRKSGERPPMTVIGDVRDQHVPSLTAGEQECGPVDLDRYFSEAEKTFMTHLRQEFRLIEDDLLIFNLVAYARHAAIVGLDEIPGYHFHAGFEPEFSIEFLSLLMECAKPGLSSSRGYYAAMVYLKTHPVPQPWRSTGKR